LVAPRIDAAQDFLFIGIVVVSHVELASMMVRGGLGVAGTGPAPLL